MSSLLLGFVVLACSTATARWTAAPVVDLGYALYQGYYSSTYDQTIYKGIRYAAPPVGKLRWQLPQPPPVHRDVVIPATENPPPCPQSGFAPGTGTLDGGGDEDCLFLNVFTPADAADLPVVVWIHGGGYGMGGAAMHDFSEQIYNNDNAYIAVVIQYRLGAFGFLSSAEVARSGVPNAGIHDIYAALVWVQKFIRRFGGDPTRVTISGMSAGAGAAMLLATANGGSDGAGLFQGIIAASPYLPTQWDYDDRQPSESYYRFAALAGCLTNQTAASGSVFDCLVSADSATLQTASNYVSTTGRYGRWAFTPVTDGALIRERPSRQLLGGGRLNGIRVLSSNTANEGPLFVPHDITDEVSFQAWLRSNYPLLTGQNVSTILEAYAPPEGASGILADSDGRGAPFSTTNSQFAAGWQQAAFNLYAEATFICPSYWLADTFARVQDGQSWHLQYSVSPGLHGDDMGAVAAMPDASAVGTSTALRTALQQIWGNFIVHGDPTLTACQVGAAEGGDVTAAGRLAWKPWGGKAGQNLMLNVNMTGGVPVATFSTAVPGVRLPVTKYMSGNDSSALPVDAAFEIVEGSAWEGGRGERCRLWASLGPWIME